MEFTLDVAFTNEQLQVLYATGTNVVIAKPAAGGASPNVAWLVFKPLNGNEIVWDEEYGIYASTAAISNGTKLTQLSNVPIPAADGKTYTLEDSGAITGPDAGGDPNTFTLVNEYSNKSYMTVGLYQNANVNGTDILKSAVSAAPVLLASTAVMIPYTMVYIWLQSNVTGNCVVTNVTSPMTKLLFGGPTSQISVAYDSASGKFLPANDTPRTAIKYIDTILY